MDYQISQPKHQTEGIYLIKLRLVFTGDGVGVGVVSGVVTERLTEAALGDSTELFPINYLKLTRLKKLRVRPGFLHS